MKTHLFVFVDKKKVGNLVIHGYTCQHCKKSIGIDEKLLNDHQFLHDNMDECVPLNKNRVDKLKEIK